MEQLPKVLLLYAHPESMDSVANKQLLNIAQQKDHVTVHDLYARYPDFFIDVHDEQRLLREHQVILFQYPLYTYGCPALLKEWMDRVLARGFANGAGGNALAGKYLRLIVTTGEPESSYQTIGFNRYTMDEFLRPFEMMSVMCHMVWLTPIVIYSARRLTSDVLQRCLNEYSVALSSPLSSIEGRVL